MRYEIKKDENKLKVWDSKDKVWITKELPSMEIANEICDKCGHPYHMHENNECPIL